MPRRSAASLAVASISVQARRLKPPEGLPEPALSLWRQLVDALPPDRFHSSDRPLLGLYCRALHQSNVAFEKLEKYGAADGDAASGAYRPPAVGTRTYRRGTRACQA
jgi:phage terminase small subunit